ncbi:hypothetical protein [Phenylobacterium sp.]|uniref:hypothetical protein n=1 Tax=Phenylobacterium sp. TaxID=1871053 RepID=UPI002F3FDE23
MRRLLILAFCAAGAGCAGGSSPDGGVANYDALAKARADCVARGEELSLIPGGDPQVISDFSCKRK